jgi:hypothetical protein
MRRKWVLGGLALLLLASCRSPGQRIEIGIGGETFQVEVARTEEERQQGLMHRKSLGAREGMIFIFPEDRRLAFWMKNTLVPLDIAFLNRAGQILQIEPMEPLSTRPIESRRLARWALEVPRGTFAKLGVKEGDTVRLPEGFP